MMSLVVLIPAAAVQREGASFIKYIAAAQPPGASIWREMPCSCIGDAPTHRASWQWCCILRSVQMVPSRVWAAVEPET